MKLEHDGGANSTKIIHMALTRAETETLSNPLSLLTGPHTDPLRLAARELRRMASQEM